MSVWSCCGTQHPGPHLNICPHAPGRVSSHDRRCDRDLCHPDCPVRRKRREDQ